MAREYSCIFYPRCLKEAAKIQAEELACKRCKRKTIDNDRMLQMDAEGIGIWALLAALFLPEQFKKYRLAMTRFDS